VTATLDDADGPTWHIRKSMRPAPAMRAILDAPGLGHHRGAMRKPRVI